MNRFLYILLFCAGRLMAQVSIGNESAVTTPTSAHYSSVLNVRPGDGETVSNNPPIFSWFYATNHLAGGDGLASEGSLAVRFQTNAFQFQIATQANFGGTLAVDTNTPTSYYNFLGPLSTNATRQFWWRVKYVTNGVSYFTNGPYTFTISVTASNWDRSLLADSTYIATNGVHPMFGFRSNQQASVWAYILTNDLNELAALTNAATAATNQSWFTSHVEWGTNTSQNPTYATINPADAFTRLNQLGSVLTLWALSGDNRWTNSSLFGWLVTNTAHVATWHNHVSNNWWAVDYGQPAGSPQLLRYLAASYDWMHFALGTNLSTSTAEGFQGRTRTNLLHALRLNARFWLNNGFYSSTPPPGQLVINYNQNYDMNKSAPWHNWFKIGTSHVSIDVPIVIPVALVGAADDAECKLFFDLLAPYLLARTTPFAGFAAHHIGVYGYVDNHIYDRSLLSGLMAFDVAFPEAQVRRTDFASRFPEWFTRMHPYRMRKYHGMYGDGLPAGYTGNVFGDKRRGWDLAAIGRSGLALQAYDLNREFSNTVSDTSSHWEQLPLRYQFRALPALQTNTTSAVYLEDGYVVASQISPSLFDCYTNGVGWSMQARPRGSNRGHDSFSDLAVDLWAYGAQLTDGGGASLDDYGYTAASSATLFVNGLGYGDVGHALYGWSPTVPVQASIIAFTNSGTNFVYACADGTALFTNSYHPLNGDVTKVRRHILFPRSKYWVVYDEFATRSNATFAFRWHVPWAFRYAAGSSALANETAFSGDRYGSNSFARTSNGFTYTAGNYADSAVPSPARVPVTMMFVNATNTFGIFEAVGTSSLGTSGTSQNGTSGTNSTLNPFISGGKTFATANPDRALGLWITNTTPATNWSLMTVIVPQQSGVAAPTITRLDDNTVAVTYDGVTETNTFGTNYTGAFTYQVATLDSSFSAPKSANPSAALRPVLRTNFRRGLPPR